MIPTHLEPDALYMPGPPDVAEATVLAAIVCAMLRQPAPVWASHTLATTTGHEYPLLLAAN